MVTAWQKYKEKSRKQNSGKKIWRQICGGASAFCQLIQNIRKW